MIVYLSYPTFTLHAFFIHKHGAAGSGNGGLTVIFHYVNYTPGIWMFTNEKKKVLPWEFLNLLHGRAASWMPVHLSF